MRDRHLRLPRADPGGARRGGPGLNLYLSGLIGSGKSTLGARLAVRLGRPFHDLDREMDRELGRSFHDLVREQGWLAFRELEYRVCKQLARLRGVVVALGGGTMRYEWNRDVLRGTGAVVLLEADLATLASRVRAADRPRVHAGASLEEDLERIWAASAPLYRDGVALVHRTDGGRDVESETEALLGALRAAGVV